jgi:hypothetical protein
MLDSLSQEQTRTGSGKLKVESWLFRFKIPESYCSNRGSPGQVLGELLSMTKFPVVEAFRKNF